MSIPLITLLTDFGRTDTYVGQMHCVLAVLAPQARVVDLTHEIAPQKILQGAVILQDAVSVAPEGAIHVAVVDPGVGSTRRGLAARIGPWWFVGPDNGLFTAVMETWPCTDVVQLDRPEFHRPLVSATFHGRDVFCPAAAALANGVPLQKIGSSLSTPPVLLNLPKPELSGKHLTGCVLWKDHFGNLITNIQRSHLSGRVQDIAVGQISGVRLVDCYADAATDELVALWGSSGRLEIAVRGGSAAAVTGLNAGAEIRVRTGGA